MFIKSIKLINFRNYETLNIEFNSKFNVIHGENAQGKTNILEAIFLCASGRSHRTSKDYDLIRYGNEEYYIKVLVDKEGNAANIEVCYERDGKKKVRINEIPIHKIGNLMGNLNAVVFSPEDLRIIKEGPSERRRFIDITISQLKPTYFYDLQQYSKILFQRNMLLKEIRKRKQLIDTLDIWNKNLVKTGSQIIKVRSEFVKKLNTNAEENHYKLTNGSERLNIKYVPSISISCSPEIEEIEKEFLKSIENNISSELIKCTTLTGPQRDDCDIMLNEMNIKYFGSQGQQRTAILSMKLSEIDIMREDTGEYPVLLLDDVMSELDNKRQEYLYENIANMQVFITCTDNSFFDEKAGQESKFFKVINGQVTVGK